MTDILADYAEEHGTTTAAPWRIGCAIDALAPLWTGRMVAEITKQTCTRYATARGRSPGTVRRELGVLRAAINHAHREGRITRTVAVHLPDRPEPRDRWLTRQEAAALLKAARQTSKARLHLPLFILIGLYTGQRKEAVLSLRWSQVDLAAGRINFNPAGRQRTNKRRPHVPIAPRLLPHLRRARLRGTDLGFVIHRDGHRVGDVKKGFAAACRRAGLEKVSPHTLRHTTATWMMQAGTPIWEAAGFLGMTPEDRRPTLTSATRLTKSQDGASRPSIITSAICSHALRPSDMNTRIVAPKKLIEIALPLEVIHVELLRRKQKAPKGWAHFVS